MVRPSTDRQKILQDDEHCPVHVTMAAHTLHLRFYLIKQQHCFRNVLSNFIRKFIAHTHTHYSCHIYFSQ